MSEQLKYAYEKLMQEYEMQLADLNADAKLAIKLIKDTERGIALQESKGRKPSKDVLAKVKTLDKWICNEILDIYNDTDKNTPIASVEPVVVEPVVKPEPKPVIEPSNIGEILDAELDLMYKSNQKDWLLDSIKGNFKAVYDIIFDNYEEKGQNGIKTTNFTLLETSEFTFTIKKV